MIRDPLTECKDTGYRAASSASPVPAKLPQREAGASICHPLTPLFARGFAERLKGPPALRTFTEVSWDW